MFNDRSDLEKRSKKRNNDKENILNILEFYRNIKNVFKKFKGKIRYSEIKPKLENLNIKDYSDDFVNFHLTINSYEYIIFIVNDEVGKITEEEWLIFSKIFIRNPAKVGAIIIWNDSELHSNLIDYNDLKLKYSQIIEYLKETKKTLEDILNKILEKPIFDLSNIKLETESLINYIDIFKAIFKFKVKTELERRLGSDKKDFIFKLNELKMNDVYDYVNFLINEKTSIENIQDFLNDLVRSLEE